MLVLGADIEADSFRRADASPFLDGRIFDTILRDLCRDWEVCKRKERASDMYDIWRVQQLILVTQRHSLLVGECCLCMRGACASATGRFPQSPSRDPSTPNTPNACHIKIRPG